MELQWLGYIGAAVMGLVLGLTGGGGSILTVPVMVYLFQIQPLIATSYSLFVVGAASLAGAISSFRQGLVNIRTALLFGSTSVLTVFITRKLIVPVIPEVLYESGSIQLTRSFLIMTLFAVLMIVASVAMIRKSPPPKTEKKSGHLIVQESALLFLYGIAIGLLTGLLGAGGGFLLIPALVLLLDIPMKEAVGTSLFIIAMNSLVGFVGDFGHFTIEWPLLLRITALAIAGIFIGRRFGRTIDGELLKRGFGWFVLASGTFILIKEIFFS